MYFSEDWTLQYLVAGDGSKVARHMTEKAEAPAEPIAHAGGLWGQPCGGTMLVLGTRTVDKVFPGGPRDHGHLTFLWGLRESHEFDECSYSDDNEVLAHAVAGRTLALSIAYRRGDRRTALVMVALP